ncbi:MAG: tRNA epoxyqueuosine(34) reductase QueG [Bdellovibrionota bacterium]
MSRVFLEQLFQKHNLEFLGVVRLGPEPTFAWFKEWLDQGFHAEMDFLKNYLERRQDPSTLIEGGVQALIFGLNYNQGDKLSEVLNGAPRIAQYARLKDYHKSLKQRGELICDELKKSHPSLNSRVMVDSAPLLERALADRTARGFIGKNTCFIHPEKGSLFLLSEILLDQNIFEIDEKVPVDRSTRSDEGGCGSCKRCQVYCPTGALDQAYRLDARKCLAYWTIEHRGTIPEEFWPHVKTYIFGCDLCQLACPYNRAASKTLEETILSAQMDLMEIACMTQADYVRMFAGTPATRAKRSGLRRNALIAMCESKDLRLEQALSAIVDEDEAVLHETRAQIERKK